MIFRKIKDKFTSFLFSNRCPYCSKVIENYELCCQKCEKALPKHGVCQGVTGGYRSTAPLIYRGRYRRALINFKFHNRQHYSKAFAKLMAKDIKCSYPDMVFDFITYVPMHKKPLKKRGFNQSELLAKELSQELHLPYICTLDKIKNTKPQHTLNGRKRLENLKGAFRVIDKNTVRNRSVLLIDDVITTGTTLGECSKTLNKAKPSHICCAALLTTAHLY
ncbi:MAG: ComF family protein [Ruminococcus sp.]|nr:ComF family protein [Ruminococcus sp.]MBQ7132987.1 ComF family protein [Ruminococcus sp.]